MQNSNFLYHIHNLIVVTRDNLNEPNMTWCIIPAARQGETDDIEGSSWSALPLIITVVASHLYMQQVVTLRV